MEQRASLIREILAEYIRHRTDREIMDKYLTDYPGSLERLAEECEVSVSTVKRVINRCSFIYKYLPEPEKD